MKKISEMTMDELSVCICNMAEPAAKIFSDAAVSEAFVEMGRRLDKKASILQNIAVFASVLVPVLLGEKHRQDTYAVLAALDGKTVDEIAKQNGLKTVKDLFSVFMADKDVSTIFRRSEKTRGE